MTLKQIIFTQSTQHIGQNFESSDELKKILLHRQFFPDGELDLKELYIDIEKPVVLVASTEAPATNLLELLFILHELENRGVRNITLFLTFLAYNRQDRRRKDSDFLNSRHVLSMLAETGIKRLLVINIHNPKTLDFLSQKNIEVYTESAGNALAHEANKIWGNMDYIVAPDAGSENLSLEYQSVFNCPVINLSKIRDASGLITQHNIGGTESVSLKDRKVLIIDDMLDTAGTIVSTVNLLRDAGVCEIYISITHGLFSKPAQERIQNSNITGLLVTDSVSNAVEISNSSNLPITLFPVYSMIHNIIFNKKDEIRS